MAFKMSHFFLVSIAVVLFFFLQSSFAIKTTWEERHHHVVQTSSLLPSSSCSSSTEGPKRKVSLDVLHKHGPCSQLNSNGKANYVETHIDILNHDKERINYIHSKLLSSSSNNNKNNKVKEELDSSSSTNLPAKSGSLIDSGNYYVVVGLGTPKRDLSLAFDTGSDLTWTQCQPCARSCYKQVDEIFDPSKSSSYHNISCTSPDCTQLLSATGTNPGCSRSTKACIYGIQYGDQSFSVGYLSHEQLTITPTDTIDNFIFGCGQDNEGLFNGIAGLLGLGRHPISIVQQTSQKYDKTFSYCLPSTSSEVGYLTLGTADNNNNVSYTSSPTGSHGNSFYYIDIVGISVGGTQLPISSSLLPSGGAIIDSGTVITRLPPTVYASLRDSFQKGMSYPRAEANGFLDTCYDLTGVDVVSIPEVSFLLGGGVTVELVVPGILYFVSSNQACLAFTANGADSDITIFGNVQQRTLEVIYDVDGGRIGFGSNGCK